MSILDSATTVLSSGFAKFSEHFLAKPLPSYCNIDTVVPLTLDDLRRNPEFVDPYTLTTTSCDLITVFDLQGMFQMVDNTNLDTLLDDLALRMTPYAKRNGHTFWFSFESDPDRAFDELALVASPQLQAARRMKMAVEDIILERVRKNAASCHFEQNFAIVMTSLNLLPDIVRKDELKGKMAALKSQKRIEFGQDLHTIYECLKNSHENIVNRIEEDFRLCDPVSSGILLRKLSAKEAIKRWRIMLNREGTAQNYQPQLITDNITPHGGLSHPDNVLPFKISWQICTQEPEIVPPAYVHTRELYHANMHMEVGPLQEQKFSELLANLDRTLPFRATFCVRPNGLSGCSMRKIMSSLMPFSSQARTTNKVLTELTEIDKTMPVVGFQANFSTWGSDLATLKRRQSALESAIQGWGVTQVAGANGDPIAHWTATVPAFGPLNPAPTMTPPLKNMLWMMPFERPAALYIGDGWLIVRTPDGKIVPLHLYSSLQDSWLELISGTPGSGKSLWLNVLNFHFLIGPGYARLPLACILDVGPSSAGLINLLRDNLPDDRKHEVVAIRLNKSSEYTTNIFDTQLGLREPLPVEERFQQDFLTRLCADEETLKAHQAIPGLVAKLITKAYKTTSTGSGMNIYERGLDPVIDELLIDSGLYEKQDEKWWENASWWEVVDMLFKAGYVTQAAIAQRYAVPILSTITQMTSSQEIKSDYDKIIVNTGENVLEYVRRCLSDAAIRFPLLSGYTRFELSSETRVVSIDLGAVIGGSQTGLFYMLGRYIGAKNFFLDEDELMPLCPTLYKSHHSRRIKDIRSEKRTICADETHNFKNDALTVGMFIKDSLEGRKQGLRLAMASQYLSHQHPDIIKAATTLYIMRGGNEDDANTLRQHFGINEVSISRLNRDCRGPTAAGANFLAVFKTKVGTVAQILTNSSSATELWGFNTNQLDMIVRDGLTKTFGSIIARSFLVNRFPSGSAIKLLDKMRKDMQNTSEDDPEVSQAVAQQLIAQLSEEIRDIQEVENA